MNRLLRLPYWHTHAVAEEARSAARTPGTVAVSGEQCAVEVAIRTALRDFPGDPSRLVVAWSLDMTVKLRDEAHEGQGYRSGLHQAPLAVRLLTCFLFVLHTHTKNSSTGRTRKPIQLLLYVGTTAKPLDSGGQLGVQGPSEGSDQVDSNICNFMDFYQDSKILDVFSWFSGGSKSFSVMF